MDGDLRGPQMRCAGAHESNHSAYQGWLAQTPRLPRCYWRLRKGDAGVAPAVPRRIFIADQRSYLACCSRGAQSPPQPPRHRASRGLANLVSWLELQGHTVQTIAKPGRLGSVIEDVSEMSATTSANDFIAFHPETGICGGENIGRDKWFPKTRPARAGFELRVARE